MTERHAAARMSDNFDFVSGARITTPAEVFP